MVHVYYSQWTESGLSGSFGVRVLLSVEVERGRDIENVKHQHQHMEVTGAPAL